MPMPFARMLMVMVRDDDDAGGAFDRLLLAGDVGSSPNWGAF